LKLVLYLFVTLCLSCSFLSSNNDTEDLSLASGQALAFDGEGEDLSKLAPVKPHPDHQAAMLDSWEEHSPQCPHRIVSLPFLTPRFQHTLVGFVDRPWTHDCRPPAPHNTVRG
jgi:hypothetical protein